MKTSLPLVLAAALTLLSSADALRAESRPPETDRQAILSMAGEYSVLFNFEETVAFQEDYRLTDVYQEEASELVLVIEDTGDRIALQHLLVVGGGNVIKHWKQVWTWEDSRMIRFLGRDRWETLDLPEEEVQGQWTQMVTQVDDSPRYESLGRWKHPFGTSTWESRLTNRPLPRREHTKRDDYDILKGVNRHTLTPYGWVHEQDNTKLALQRGEQAPHLIARETGVNYYDVVEGEDFSNAREYWDETSDYWALVAREWERVVNQQERYRIRPKVGGQKLYERMFAMAEEDGIGEREIRQVIDQYLQPLDR